MVTEESMDDLLHKKHQFRSKMGKLFMNTQGYNTRMDDKMKPFPFLLALCKPEQFPCLF